MKKLNSWFEISEEEYIWYILQGYDIEVGERNVAWKLDGEEHREDGPAYIDISGYQSWWLKGKRHREDGPAIIFASGNIEWYLNDIKYSRHEFKLMLGRNKNVNER